VFIALPPGIWVLMQLVRGRKQRPARQSEERG
jgi:hypothetical protein